ncbi:hypothetical protein HDU80_000074 [Chytriomyces hyalinus]|nr:hypothetical protein HDU80_000074 [Chytriomyces hyalinus]
MAPFGHRRSGPCQYQQPASQSRKGPARALIERGPKFVAVSQATTSAKTVNRNTGMQATHSLSAEYGSSSDQEREAVEAMLNFHRSSQSPPHRSSQGDPSHAKDDVPKAVPASVETSLGADVSAEADRVLDGIALSSLKRLRPCDSCRAMRKRCDFESGENCTRCTERGETCAYTDEMRKKPCLSFSMGGTAEMSSVYHIPAAAVPDVRALSDSPYMQQAILASLDESPRIAKTRRHAACTACHTKKIKCDMLKPSCTGCYERSKVCVYPIPPQNSDAEPRKTHFALPKSTLISPIIPSQPIPSETSTIVKLEVPGQSLASINPSSSVAVRHPSLGPDSGDESIHSVDNGYYSTDSAASRLNQLSQEQSQIDSSSAISSAALAIENLSKPQRTSFPAVSSSPVVSDHHLSNTSGAHRPASASQKSTNQFPLFNPSYFERDPNFISRFKSKKQIKQAAITAAALASNPGTLSLADIVLDKLPRVKPGIQKRIKCGKLWILDPETAEKVYFCPICRKDYTTANGLKYHLSLHTDFHNMPPGYYWSKESATEDLTKVFQCTVEPCRKAYSTLAGLKYHMGKGKHGSAEGKQSGDEAGASSSEDEEDLNPDE